MGTHSNRLGAPRDSAMWEFGLQPYSIQTDRVYPSYSSSLSTLGPSAQIVLHLNEYDSKAGSPIFHIEPKEILIDV